MRDCRLACAACALSRAWNSRRRADILRMMPGRGIWSRRAERWLRLAARVLVLAVVLLSAIGPRSALAATQLLDRSNPRLCACPHATEHELKSCCCHHDQRGDHPRLVEGGGCCAHTAVAPPAGFAELGFPPLVGLAAVPEVSSLHDRPLQLRLERPPRA